MPSTDALWRRPLHTRQAHQHNTSKHVKMRLERLDPRSKSAVAEASLLQRPSSSSESAPRLRASRRELSATLRTELSRICLAFLLSLRRGRATRRGDAGASDSPRAERANLRQAHRQRNKWAEGVHARPLCPFSPVLRVCPSCCCLCACSVALPRSAVRLGAKDQ
jgi:hypothetical protein